MHIGLFGGSFNPPHIGHLIVAETVRDQFDLDMVWWIPTYRPPHKPDAELADAAHRLAMVHRAIEGNPGFDVCDAEIRRRGISYTVDTVRELKQARPDDRFSLIIGSDSLMGFSSWYRPEEIIRRVPILAYTRPGAPRPEITPHYRERIRFAEAPLIDVSGTEIRRRCAEGRSIRYLVPDSVRRYMEKQSLYQHAEKAAAS